MEENDNSIIKLNIVYRVYETLQLLLLNGGGWELSFCALLKPLYTYTTCVTLLGLPINQSVHQGVSSSEYISPMGNKLVLLFRKGLLGE